MTALGVDLLWPSVSVESYATADVEILFLFYIIEKKCNGKGGTRLINGFQWLEKLLDAISILNDSVWQLR